MGSNTVCLRWFSVLNEWMDFLVLVPAWAKEVATEAIYAGMSEFWDNDCLCYGDCVDDALMERGVPYFCDYLDESRYTQDSWERHVGSLESIGIPVINLWRPL